MCTYSVVDPSVMKLRLRSTGSKPVKCVQGPIVYVSNYSWHSTLIIYCGRCTNMHLQTHWRWSRPCCISRADPFRQSMDIFVGRTGNELCPVAATLAYMVQRGPGPGSLFKFQDGKPLTRQRFVARAREALSSAGVDCSAYSGHSFRSGAATTAAKCGVSDAMI